MGDSITHVRPLLRSRRKKRRRGTESGGICLGIFISHYLILWGKSQALLHYWMDDLMSDGNRPLEFEIRETMRVYWVEEEHKRKAAVLVKSIDSLHPQTPRKLSVFQKERADR